MLVSDPPMLGFRALQAIVDLRAAAGRQPREAIREIAARIPPSDRNRGAGSQTLTRIILHQGCRLETAEDRVLIDALQLTASQSDADLAAFSAATAILLADRLQHGLYTETMADFWECCHDAYTALPPHDRAAILQGYLTGTELGRVKAPDLERNENCLSQSRETVQRMLLDFANKDRDVLLSSVSEIAGDQMAALLLPELRGLLRVNGARRLDGDSPLFAPLLAIAGNARHAASPYATALLLEQAASTGDAEGWFSITLWPEMAAHWLSAELPANRALLAGLRYLYEAHADWEPMPRRRVSPKTLDRVALLPVMDDSFAGARNGSRTD